MLKETERDNDKRPQGRLPCSTPCPLTLSLRFREFILWVPGHMLAHWRLKQEQQVSCFFHSINTEILYTWQGFKNKYRTITGHNSTYRWAGEEWCIAFFCLRQMLRKVCEQEALLGCLREHHSAGLSSAGPYVPASSAFLANGKWTEACEFLVLPKRNRENTSF